MDEAFLMFLYMWNLYCGNHCSCNSMPIHKIRTSNWPQIIKFTSILLCFRGYKRFFRRTALEASDFLKDDCLKINCTVGVVVSTIDYSRPHSIHVPDSDIGYDFGSLLDSQEGVDVILNVGGEWFHAHKLVLAARSHVFKSQFFDDESDGEKSEVNETDELKEFSIDDMEPKVFKVCCCSCIVFILLVKQ